MVFDPLSIRSKCPKLSGNRFFSHLREAHGEDDDRASLRAEPE